ncbi:MAG: RsmD family RNA methyltransferase [Acidimicrobiales bacterium]
MRVVAGTAKGRRLAAPPGGTVRPTGDRVREAAFDILGSRGGVATWSVVDLFAGTGAMGIEALSRGAAAATFVDHDPAALESLRVNLVSTGLYTRGTVVQADVAGWLGSAPSFDLAFMDPPYAFADWASVLDALRATLVVVESDRPVEVPGRWEVETVKHYGGTVLTLARTQTAADNRGGE